MDKKEYQLPIQSIRALGLAFGITPNRLVTFLNLPQEGDSLGIALEEALKEMIKNILNCRNVTLITLMEREEGITNTAVCTKEKNLVYWGMDQEVIKLKAMETDQFAGGFATFLNQGNPLKKQVTALSLNWDQLVTLMGLTDLFVTNKMMALLEHRPRPAPLTISGLKGITVGAINRPDPRWLTTNILTYGHKGQRFDLDAGIQDLAEMEILEKAADGTLLLRSKGQTLINGLAEPEVLWGLKSYCFEVRNLILVSQIVFRTRHQLWSVDFNSDNYILRCVDYNEVAAALAAIICRGDDTEGEIPNHFDQEIDTTKASVSATRSEDLLQIPQAICSHCGNKLLPGDQFCNKCGTPVHRPKPEISAQIKSADQETRACPRCGAVLKPGNRFCTGCGASVTAGSPIKRTCPSCGANVSENAKFCLKCGSKLE